MCREIKDCLACPYKDCIHDGLLPGERRVRDTYDRELEAVDPAVMKRRERYRRYRQSEKGREAQRRYAASQKGKKRSRRYMSSEKGKATQWRYQENKKGAVRAPQSIIYPRRI